jgi:hypothetical protein
MGFDLIRCGWKAECSTCGKATVPLQSFRAIEPLAGSDHGWQVEWECQLCQGRSTMLRNSAELDLDPILDPWPIHYEFMSGQSWWIGSTASPAAASLAQGKWPFRWRCGQTPRFGSLTQLRILEPYGRKLYQTKIDCSCGEYHWRTWPSERLQLERLMTKSVA